jgi:septum formation protein
MQQIILASGSPRRKEILELLGLEFLVVESGYDEDLIKTNDPVELVEELALQKALEVTKRYPDAIVIGGDTTVTFGAGSIAKANSKEEAMAMFGQLLGKTHQVVTGVAVVNSLTGEQFVGHEVGSVTFREGTASELDQYVANERNWRGFAGAYTLQGGAAPFAINQSGKLSAIIGMPVELTCELLEAAGEVIDVDPVQVEYDLHGMKVGIEE